MPYTPEQLDAMSLEELNRLHAQELQKSKMEAYQNSLKQPAPSKNSNTSRYTAEQLDALSLEELHALKAKHESEGLSAIKDVPKVLGEGVKDLAAGFLHPIASLFAAPYNIPKNISAKERGESYKPFLFGVRPPEEAIFPEAYLGGQTASLFTPFGAISKALGVPSKFLKSGNIFQNATKAARKFIAPGKEAGRIEKYLPELLDAAVEGGAYGAAYSSGVQHGDVEEAAKLGAPLNALTHALFRAPSAIGEEYLQNIVKKSKEPGSKIRTPQQVKELDKTIGELPIDLGTLTNDPHLDKLYRHWIANIFGSGGIDKANKVLNTLNEKGQNILDELLGSTKPTGVGEVLRAGTIKPYKELSNKSRNDFKTLSKEADKAGILITERPNLKEFSKEKLEELKREIKTKSGSLVPSSEKSELQKHIKSPKEFPTLNEFDLLRKKYRKKARLANRAGDEVLKSFYNDLADNAEKDLVNTLEKSGRNDLVDIFNKARPDFRVNVLPFRERNIKKIREGTLPDELIAEELRKPANKKVWDSLPEEARKNALYDLFEKGATFDDRGNPKANIARMVSTFKKMSPEERARLLKDSEKPGHQIGKKLHELETINELSDTSKLIINSPNTGYVNQKHLAAFLPLVLGSAAGGLADHNNNLPPYLAPLLGGLASTLVGHKISKSLTSKNGLRKNYINEGKVPQSSASKYTEERVRNILNYYSNQ